MKLTTRDYLLLPGIAVAAIVLRVYGLDLNGFWNDEVFSAEIARLPILELIARTAVDVHPPLYYLLLRGWTLLTGSEHDGTMRGLCVLLDLGGILATAELGWTVFRERRMVYAATLVHAFSPHAVLYAQELRMYSLLLLASTISLSSLIKLTRGSSRGAWVAYVLATLAALYTHIFAVFMVAAQNLWFLLRARNTSSQPGWPRWLITQTGIGLVFAPWAWVIYRQMSAAAQTASVGEWWIPRPPVKALAGVPYVLLGNSTLVFALALVLIGYGAWVTLRTRERTTESAWFGSVVVFAFCELLVFAMSRLTTPIFVSRFFTECLPALWLLVLYGFFVMKPRFQQAAVGIFVVANCVAILPYNYSNSFKAPTRLREALREIASREEGMVVTKKSAAVAHVWRWYSGVEKRSTSLREPKWLSSIDELGQLTFSEQTYLVWPASEALPASIADATGAQASLVERIELGSFAFAQYNRAALR